MKLLGIILVASALTAQTTRPAIDHMVTASGFGAYPGVAAPSSWVEIYGSNLAGTTRSWATSDFNGTAAPTTLDGVTVTINGIPAYISYVSPTQINVELPDGLATGGALPVVVSYGGLSSTAASLTINTLQPGLLAPSTFQASGKQYVVALHSATGAYVGNGSIANVPSNPAVANETLVFFGVGFGTVTGATVAGKTAASASTLTNTFSMTIGGSTATVAYAGLAPGLVGLYQFNVVEPTGLATGDAVVQAKVNGTATSQQTLYLPVTGSGIPPSAPTGIAITPGNTTLTLSFTAPASNGGSAITSYTATCTANGTSKTGTGTASPILVTGLTNGTTYSCTLSASNTSGAGTLSNAGTGTPSLGSTGTYNTLWIPDTITGTNFNLTLAPGTKQIRTGDATSTYSYNNSGFWGPTLIMNKGDFVQMNVTNKLSEATTTHWHGFHIPPVTDGGPHQPIAAGETWTPSFEIKNNAAMYWYHPHLHEKTVDHLLHGAGGFIIIKDTTEAALPLPRTYGIDDLPLVLTSRKFLSGGNQFNLDVSVSPYGDYELTNGTMNAQVNLPAQFVRLRVLNAEIERAYNLGFKDGRTFYVIGNDGGLLDAPVAVTRLKVYVGERYEILVDLTKDAAGSSLDLQAFNGGQTFGFPGGEPATTGTFGSLLNNTTFNVLHINVTTPTANAITSLPSKLVTNTYLTSSDATSKRTVNITDKGPGTPFSFDSAAYNMDKINQTVTLNGVEAWTISNNRTFSHAFHIHDVQFKIVARSTGTIASYEQGWKDTVSVPLGETVTFVAKFDDFSDVVNPYMYHCHFSNHEDEGMMGQFIVVKP